MIRIDCLAIGTERVQTEMDATRFGVKKSISTKTGARGKKAAAGCDDERNAAELEWKKLSYSETANGGVT
jgi:hypothetical protein